MSGADLALLCAHHARYPRMQAQDIVKLLYQSEFGPRHLGDAADTLAQHICAEWQAVPDAVSPDAPERIGGGLCRFPLIPGAYSQIAAQLLAELMLQTAQRCGGSAAHLRQRLEQAAAEQPAVRQWLAEQAWDYQTPVHHSRAFAEAYRPHYRLLRQEYAAYFPLLLQIAQRLREKQSLLLAIDGCCGSGKTQLAALMQAIFPCRVFHTDHYYLPIVRRAADWQAQPAGNMDLSRLCDEVVQPARRGEPVQQRVFDCAAQRLGEVQTVQPMPLTVVEGSYALHSQLVDQYDLRIFLTCSPEAQQARLRAREGAYFDMFRQVWIPMEQLYYARCNPLGCQPMQLDTTRLFRELSDSLDI